jgi:hypothetical protein
LNNDYAITQSIYKIVTLSCGVADLLSLKDEEIKQIKKKNEGKGRGKKLETENKELICVWHVF